MDLGVRKGRGERLGLRGELVKGCGGSWSGEFGGLRRVWRV